MLTQRMILATIGLMLAASASAYDNDTHYYFTYYLARKAGYTPEQARRVASADISIDLDPPTEPMQPVTKGSSIPSPGPWPTYTSDVRLHYHSFMRLEPFSQGSAEERLKAYATSFRAKSLGSVNPGPYLHFYQDSYSHAGYGTILGHWLSNKTGDFSQIKHKADYLSFDKAKATAMTKGTLAFLVEYRNRRLNRSDPVPDFSTVSPMLDALIAANTPAKADVSPDENKARAIVAQALGETVPTIIDYNFDKNAVPSAARKSVFDVFG